MSKAYIAEMFERLEGLLAEYLSQREHEAEWRSNLESDREV